MPTITPSWTDNIDVVAIATLARNATTSGTIDLSAKFGAFLFLRVGRTGTTGLTNGVAIRVNKLINAATIRHVSSLVPLLGQATAAQSTTCATSDSNSGQAILTVASTTSFAVDDYMLLVETGGGFTRAEFVRVARVTSSTAFLLDGNLQFTHTSAAADTVRNKADVYPPIWLPGGSQYEVIFDYGDDSAGDSVIVQAKAQRYDSDTIA